MSNASPDREDVLSTPSWSAAWHAVGAHPSAGLREALLAAYTEPERHYHTLQHLQECLELLERTRDYAERASEVALALWFHDAIYDAHRRDSELRSADWARRALIDGGASEDAASRVHALVMATRHAASPRGADAELLVDIDLAILGAPDARFDEYDRQIRAEYAFLPEHDYRRGRRGVLEGFLARPAIYATATLRAEREITARTNLARALQRL